MQISNEIINVMNYIGEKFGVVIDWTNVNIFPYIQQLCEKIIRWEIATSCVWIIAGSLIAIITLIILNKNKEIGIERYTYASDDYSGRIFIYLLFVGIPLVIIFVQLFDIIECCMLPEKAVYDFILKYISGE